MGGGLAGCSVMITVIAVQSHDLIYSGRFKCGYFVVVEAPSS